MSLSLIILHLAGAVTLLVWAVRMVRTGVERAHSTALRRLMRSSRGGWVQASGVGAATAVMLQSSTAVAMLASGLAASGIMSISVGLAMLLGADLGSALVVQILSLDLSWLMPILLIAGGWLFMKGTSRTVKQTGRILIGIALILVSLGMVAEATAPLRESEFLPVVFDYLKGDFVTSFLMGALFTWLVHSSVASILLFMTFASQGAMPVELGISLMLGANLGGGLIAAGLTRGAAPDARRIPIGNLLFRGTGAIVALVALQIFEAPLHLLGESSARQIASLHLVFNLALLLVCLPFCGLVERLLRRFVNGGPGEAEGLDPIASRVSALDRSVVHDPRQALTSATRELLRMAEIVEIMLRPVMELYESGTKERIKQLRRLDAEVNRAHSDIKLYVTEINRGSMSAEDARRAMELTSFAINLEAAGDVISKSLLRLAGEKTEKNLDFSAEGWRELTDLHDRVMTNMQLALNVLVSGEPDSARQLLEEKDRMRELERASHDRHIERLQSGSVKSIETSDIHLETVRALKQVNSALASVAYPILAESGDLLDSRLAQSA